MKKESAILVSEFIFFFVVAVGLNAWLNFEKESAAIFGVLGFISWEAIKLRIGIQQIDSSVKSLSGFIRGYLGEGSLSELALIYSKVPDARVSPEGVTVPKREILNFWWQCISRTKSGWRCTNYTGAKVSWSTGWGSGQSLRIQQDRISAGCKITRIFIVDRVEELNDFASIMEEQIQAGIDVKWILKDELLNTDAMREAELSLGTIDFAIVDSDWLFMVNLRGREFASASASKAINLIDAAKFLISEADSRGQQLSIPLDI